MLFLTLTSNNTKWRANMMSPSDQLSSSIDSSLSHLQRQQVTTVSLLEPSWIYKQATLDPVPSVLPLILPWQRLLLYKSPPYHCLLLLDVPCSDEKILFLFLTRACQEAASFCFASLLALLLTCLPRGRRSQLRKSALFQFLLKLHHAPVVHLLALVTLNCHLVPHIPVGIGHLSGKTHFLSISICYN